MNKDYTYSAFISYSHKDQKYAQKLQKKLESYRLPSTLQHQIEKKSKHPVSPVFRDATDLVAGKLRENLHQELENSKFLIVICSPNSAHDNAQGKNYVNAEVEHFIALGKSDYIIPLIIDGIPGDHEKECFCQAVKSLELVGIDATKFSEARVINDIVAKILGLRPDELWQREKRRIFRKKVYAVTGILLAVFSAVAVGGYCWDYNRNYTEYYADYVEKWNIPCGIEPLNKEDLKFRYRHLRFLYRGRSSLFGKRVLREVTLHNSSGEILSDSEKIIPADILTEYPVRQTFNYNENGILAYTEYWTYNSIKYKRKKYSGQNLRFIDIEPVHSQNDAMLFKNIVFDKIVTDTTIRRIDVTRDNEGKIIKGYFRSGVNKFALKNNNGNYGYILEYDQKGRVRKVYYLNFDGQPIMTKKGYMESYDYSSEGYITKISYYDIQNKLYDKHLKYASIEVSHDAYGNITSAVYYDSFGKPAVSENNPIKIVLLWKNGNAIERTRFFAPAKSNAGKGKSIVCRYEYDQAGNVIRHLHFNAINNKRITFKNYSEKQLKYVKIKDYFLPSFLAFLDTKGNFCATNDKIAMYNYKYDPKGNLIEEKRYGIDGKLLKSGMIAVVRKKYNSSGACTEYANYDLNDQLIVDSRGVAVYQWEYRGMILIEKYFNTKRQLFIAPEEGCAFLRKTRNEFGQIILWECFGDNGEKINNKHYAWHRLSIKFDANGNVAEMSFYDKNGCKCVTNFQNSRFAVMRLKHDGNNRTEQAFYDANDNLLTQAKGFAVIQTRYLYNRVHEVLLLNAKRQLCKPKGGDNARSVVEYYPDGRKKSCTYYSLNGEYTIHELDKHENMIRRSYHLPDGSLVADSNGVAKITYEYDERNRECKRSFYGVDGKLVKTKNEQISGWKYRYDSDGNKCEESYFDQEGRVCNNLIGIAKIVFKYANYRQIEKRFYDKHNTLTGNANGICIIQNEYNSNGDPVITRYLGKDGKLKNKKSNGVALTRNKYDENHRLIEYRNFDSNMRPCLNNMGVAGGQYRYDSLGRIIEICFLGKDGKLTVCKDGYAIEQNKYDSLGYITETCYYDQNLKPVNNKKGHAIYRIKHDNLGRILAIKAFDKNGNPTSISEDSNGKIEEESITYDRLGNAVKLSKLLSPLNSQGVYYIETIETERGDVLKRSFLDKNKKLMNTHWGFAVRKYRYNDYREMIEESFWDQDGRPAIQKSTGVSKMLVSYDRTANGLTITQRYQDHRGFAIENNGSAYCITKLNNRNNIVSCESWKKNGTPIKKCQIEYDNYGHMISYSEYSNVQKNNEISFQLTTSLKFQIDDQKKTVTVSYNNNTKLITLNEYFQFENIFRTGLQRIKYDLKIK